MQEHPNSIITRICAKAGLQLKKGQAAKIQAEVPDLDPEKVLAIAGLIAQEMKPAKVGNSATRKRIRNFIRHRVDAFLAENPDLSTLRDRLLTTVAGELAARLPSPDALIPDEDQMAAIEAVARPLRDEVHMWAWFAGLDGAHAILREAFKPDLWQDHAGQVEDLEQALLERSRKALFMTGAKEVPDPGLLITALVTPVPIEGPDPNHRGRRALDRVLTVVLPTVERACGPEKGPFRTSPLNRTILLARMFPGLGGEGPEAERVATLDALIRAREAEAAERKRAEVRAERDRRAYEAQLVRRDELETLLPATRVETLRWVQDGRIPVAVWSKFQKWGKKLQVSMHDPDLLPDWKGRIEAWRVADTERAATRAGKARAIHARETRVRNLLKAALPESTPTLVVLDKGFVRFAVDLVAPVDLPIPTGTTALCLRVPMRVQLPDELWGPVGDGPISGKARSAAVGAMRDGLTGLLAGYRAEAAPALAVLAAELTGAVEGLPADIFEAFREAFEVEILESEGGGCDVYQLDRFLRPHAISAIRHAEELHRDRVLARASGLADYPALFPQARLMRRQIHLHIGPTNSGKTHAAIERLKAAPSGLYAAPLRLMAMEWADRLNADGVPTDLVTGEEVVRVEAARHQSVTIEMSPLRTPVDVVVIDEAQLIGDEERGWAWTQAILGLPARELHLTGSPDAEPWVRLLAGMTGDELTVHHYDRLVPLVLSERPVRAGEIRPGDAIIAFSRARVLEMREQLRSCGYTVATVYGALSPEVRREEARRFRSGEAGFLVATDAIGMGLNLPVRRVLLAEGVKFDGAVRRPLLDSEIRQIVGRAGRFGLSDAEAGVAAAYAATDGAEALQDRIGRAIAGKPTPPDTIRPRVKPGGEVVWLLGELMRTDRLLLILQTVHERILSRDPVFRSGVGPEMLLVASVMDRTPLPLEDRHAYACAPVDTRDETSWDGLMRWVRAHAMGERVPYDIAQGRSGKVRTQGDLAVLESLVKATGLYLWCAHRWPEVYTETERAVSGRSALNAAISAALRGGKLSRACRECGRGLPDGHRFAICDGCHRATRYQREWEWD
jgi:ATP-dependent RNA helicase SUPV3L1/SUV3